MSTEDIDVDIQTQAVANQHSPTPAKQGKADGQRRKKSLNKLNSTEVVSQMEKDKMANQNNILGDKIDEQSAMQKAGKMKVTIVENKHECNAMGTKNNNIKASRDIHEKLSMAKKDIKNKSQHQPINNKQGKPTNSRDDVENASSTTRESIKNTPTEDSQNSVALTMNKAENAKPGRIVANKTSMASKSILKKSNVKDKYIPMSVEVSASSNADVDLQREILTKIQENHEKAMRMVNGTSLSSTKINPSMGTSIEEVHQSKFNSKKAFQSAGARVYNRGNPKSFEKPTKGTDSLNNLSKSLTDSSIGSPGKSKEDTQLNINDTKESKDTKQTPLSLNGVRTASDSVVNTRAKPVPKISKPNKKPRIIVSTDKTYNGPDMDEVFDAKNDALSSLSVGGSGSVESSTRWGKHSWKSDADQDDGSEDSVETSKTVKSRDTPNTARNFRQSIPKGTQVRNNAFALNGAETALKMMKYSSSPSSPRVQRSTSLSTEERTPQPQRQVLTAKKVKLGPDESNYILTSKQYK